MVTVKKQGLGGKGPQIPDFLKVEPDADEKRYNQVGWVG